MPTSNSHTRKRWEYGRDLFNNNQSWALVGCKVAYWKEKVRPSRWPKLLAALSYAEKLIEVLSSACSSLSPIHRPKPTIIFLLFTAHSNQVPENSCGCWQVYDFEEEEWSVLTEKPGHVFGTPMCFLQVPLAWYLQTWTDLWFVGQALHPRRCAK